MTLDDVTPRLSHNAGFDDCFDKTAGAKVLHALLLALIRPLSAGIARSARAPTTFANTD